MRSSYRLINAVLLTAIVAFACVQPVRAQTGSNPESSRLSPYWGSAVSRWDDVILQYAQERRLDPDLIAAVIWKESLGHSEARGPTGAVGLMGLKSFEWRPSPEELGNPHTNLFWGARALAHTIQDGRGDLYYSLAAYNGGWDQIHLRVTRRYATSVLDHYVRAVAMRHGLSADGGWASIIAVEGASGSNTIIVLGPQRPLARYTERPWLQARIPSVPKNNPPHATAITFSNDQGEECRVNVWLVTEGGSLLGSSDSHPLVAEVVSAGSLSRMKKDIP